MEGDSVTGGHAVLIDWGLCCHVEASQSGRLPAPIIDVSMLLRAYDSLYAGIYDLDDTLSALERDGTSPDGSPSCVGCERAAEWQPPDRFSAALKLAAEGVFGLVAPGASAA
ncbi:hypothetical protein EON66_10340 [archaeon]|nr:MAG: hypothetical protein EON66_10340 [archaeon]